MVRSNVQRPTWTASHTQVVVAEVVTYDPVRRRGFVRVIDRPWRGRILFALGELSGPLKDEIVEASRELNRARKKPRSSDAFHLAMRKIKRIIVGRRMPVEIRYSSQTCLPRVVAISA